VPPLAGLAPASHRELQDASPPVLFTLQSATTSGLSSTPVSKPEQRSADDSRVDKPLAQDVGREGQSNGVQRESVAAPVQPSVSKPDAGVVQRALIPAVVMGGTHRISTASAGELERRWGLEVARDRLTVALRRLDMEGRVRERSQPSPMTIALYERPWQAAGGTLRAEGGALARRSMQSLVGCRRSPT
jgi:hypothetical protein